MGAARVFKFRFFVVISLFAMGLYYLIQSKGNFRKPITRSFATTFFEPHISNKIQSQVQLLSTIKVLIWISPTKELRKNRQETIQNVINTMNGNQESLCPNVNVSKQYCEFSKGEKNITEADAVVFYTFTSDYKLSGIPNITSGRSDQIWIWYADEPPALLTWSYSLENLFNWTMTYRIDSDVWAPYGTKYKIVPNEKQEIYISGNTNVTKWISEKSKVAVAVISRCQSDSNREKLIEQLRKAGVQIDVYGRCGNQTICGRNDKNCSIFWNDVARQYRFYLAFENSVCHDYITEKFWRPLSLGMVPVVFGGGNYAFEAPPHSYIDVRSYNSTTDFANYVKKLVNSDSEYAEYFEWRKTFGVDRTIFRNWCILCQRLHQKKTTEEMRAEAHSNLKQWWERRSNSVQEACQKHPNNFFQPYL